MTTTTNPTPGDATDELLLTVEEAAAVLRIGRSLAYDLARRYEASGGIAGMPNIRLSSGCRRVPRWALVELASTGRIVQLDHQLLP